MTAGPAPTRTPSSRIAPAPIQAPSSTTIPRAMIPCCMTGREGSLNGWFTASIWTRGARRAESPTRPPPASPTDQLGNAPARPVLLPHDTTHCCPQIRHHLEAMLPVKPAADQLPATAASEYEIAAAPYCPSSLYVRLRISNEVGPRKIQPHLHFRFQQQARLWLAAGTTLVGTMGAVHHPVYPPPGSLDAAHHARMDVLHHLHWSHAPVDDRLVGDDDDVQVQASQAGQGLQRPREEDELLPTFHMIVSIATDHPIAVHEDGPMHTRPHRRELCR